jgi:tetratricopeptide (TPR) repeat protein
MKTLVIFLFAFSVLLFANAQRNNSSHVPTLRVADSLFLSSKWSEAIPVYEAVLKTQPANSLGWNRLGFSYHNLKEYDKAIVNYNNALKNQPSPQLKAIVHSRLARVYLLKDKSADAMKYLQLALQSGYSNVSELENHADFATLRSTQDFKKIVEQANSNAFPCLSDKKAREFDFWVGEWDVYLAGTTQVVGESKIEIASGGCMILENWKAIGPQQHNGKSMNYINQQSGKWEQLWIGSNGLNINNPQKFIDGEYKDGAMRFMFEQVDNAGKKQIGRFIFFNEGPDQVRQFNEISSDGGATWTTVYNFTYKRRKA